MKLPAFFFALRLTSGATRVVFGVEGVENRLAQLDTHLDRWQTLVKMFFTIFFNQPNRPN